MAGPTRGKTEGNLHPELYNLLLLEVAIRGITVDCTVLKITHLILFLDLLDSLFSSADVSP